MRDNSDVILLSSCEIIFYHTIFYVLVQIDVSQHLNSQASQSMRDCSEKSIQAKQINDSIYSSGNNRNAAIL